MVGVIGSLVILTVALAYIFWRKKTCRILLEQQKHAEQKLGRQIEELIIENEKLKNVLREFDIKDKLVTQSPNAIMLMDKDGNVNWVNKGFSTMYEYNYSDFVKARGGNIRKTSFNPAVIERINRCIETKKPVKYEAINITKTGKELWTQTALMPILDDAKNVVGLVTIDSDIHHRVKVSENLIQRMEEIKIKLDKMSEQFCLLVADSASLFQSINQSKQIIDQTGQIVKFIKEISDTTKILGINASIEANSAGQHGKGFRVIANDIVDISNKTIQSVSQIDKMLNSVNQSHEKIYREKAASENTIMEYDKLIKALKNEISDVEMAIDELKSLT